MYRRELGKYQEVLNPQDIPEQLFTIQYTEQNILPIPGFIKRINEISGALIRMQEDMARLEDDDLIQIQKMIPGIPSFLIPFLYY